jgi:hypothetical protein
MGHAIPKERRTELKMNIQIFFKTHKGYYFKLRRIMEYMGNEKYNQMEVKNVLAEMIKNEQIETLYRCNRLKYRWKETI